MDAGVEPCSRLVNLQGLGKPEKNEILERRMSAYRVPLRKKWIRRISSAMLANRRTPMPKVKANNITMNYDQQGAGEPLILIPYLAADHACYAFQVAEYAKHFTCISLDLRGTGESDNPDSPYSTEVLADDIAAFLQAKQIEKTHISGLSLGAAV